MLLAAHNLVRRTIFGQVSSLYRPIKTVSTFFQGAEKNRAGKSSDKELRLPTCAAGPAVHWPDLMASWWLGGEVAPAYDRLTHITLMNYYACSLSSPFCRAGKSAREQTHATTNNRPAYICFMRPYTAHRYTRDRRTVVSHATRRNCSIFSTKS